jgi:NADH dehydrogenase
VGDCAAIIDPTSKTPYPPTAQQALREGRRAGKNIYAQLKGKRTTPFLYQAPGQLASIGRRTGVARVFGLKFSGVLGWVLWRTVYVMKLPRLEKKLRVVLQWVLDVAFERDLGQHVTLRDVETLIGCSKQRSNTTHEVGSTGPISRFWASDGQAASPSAIFCSDPRKHYS